jgi:hypothetical protein
MPHGEGADRDPARSYARLDKSDLVRLGRAAQAELEAFFARNLHLAGGTECASSPLHKAAPSITCAAAGGSEISMSLSASPKTRTCRTFSAAWSSPGTGAPPSSGAARTTRRNTPAALSMSLSGSSPTAPARPPQPDRRAARVAGRTRSKKGRSRAKSRPRPRASRPHPPRPRISCLGPGRGSSAQAKNNRASQAPWPGSALRLYDSTPRSRVLMGAQMGAHSAQRCSRPLWFALLCVARPVQTDICGAHRIGSAFLGVKGSPVQIRPSRPEAAGQRPFHRAGEVASRSFDRTLTAGFSGISRHPWFKICGGCHRVVAVTHAWQRRPGRRARGWRRSWLGSRCSSRGRSGAAVVRTGSLRPG